MVKTIKKLIQGYDVKITSTDRTWEQQLAIILRPKYKKNYKNIKKRFLKNYGLKALPSKRDLLTAEQAKWWEREIMKQAGKPKGFAHVGGNAVDITVGKLSLDEKKVLKEKIEAEGRYKVYPEQVTKGKPAKYGVALKAANVFHIFRTGRGGQKKESTSHPRPKAEILDRIDQFMQARRSGIWI